MKQTIATLALLAAMCLASWSCANNKSEAQQQEEASVYSYQAEYPATAAESAVEEETASVAYEAEAAEPEEDEPFVSAALEALFLRGPVKRVVYSENNLAIAFSREGRPISIRLDRSYGRGIKLDSDGLLSEVHFKDDWGTKITFEYDYQGCLAYVTYTGHESLIRYIYTGHDEFGNPTYRTLDSAAEGYGLEFRGDVTYSGFDSHGNWTEETVSGTETESDPDDNSTSGSRTATFKRTIEYWD